MPQNREAYTRPSAIVLSSRMETRVVVASSTPLDEPFPYAPTQLTVSPIDLPQSIGVSVSVSFNIVITPSDHEQLAEWSSRYDIPVPIREDTVKLRQRVVIPVAQTVP